MMALWANMYTRIALIAAVLLLVGYGVYGYGFAKGTAKAELKATQAALKFRERESQLIVELEAEKARKKVIVNERIKVIQGNSGDCGATDMPDNVIRVLDDAYRSAP